ncbi:MAG: protein-glutamate O-methyltransferase CheR [Thiohalomonadales bacterium]|nr:protein-glutamate O-methyltransferase CheR [Thiohalomonadales bacterium]
MALAQNKQEQASLWRRRNVAPMDNYEFRQWVELLEKRTGISLPEKRKSFLLANLNIRMRELGYEKYQEYFRHLLAGRRGAVEWEILVDRLTVHETRFFRDITALEMLEDCYLNTLPTSDSAMRINIWSVGCATGEEPYSLAMFVDKVLSARGVRHYLAITASDISSASLATGRTGNYHRNRLKNLPDEYRDSYFKTIDADHYEVDASLRERVCFTRLNLLHLDEATLGMMDIIFCQNVLIYFKREQRRRILDELVEHLRPGGILVLGAGEITEWQPDDLESLGYPGTLAFRRRQRSGSDV